ncbi:hypothetical protein ElyMa_004644900 [Elysia marginata]|uniref:Uncharacterized protein n=1 Tax=Elysia marginata TaxID=1093978 RepID=A0AAV4I1B9_9GAST|nr:hypothetical protein ElyMa_004644900 [Elysia marginata]
MITRLRMTYSSGQSNQMQPFSTTPKTKALLSQLTGETTREAFGHKEKSALISSEPTPPYGHYHRHPTKNCRNTQATLEFQES